MNNKKRPFNNNNNMGNRQYNNTGHKPRSRNYNNNGNSGNNQLSINKIYDSNGPDGKVRGTAQVIYEKYQNLARDAHSAGDRVLAENYLQHAEHYLRIIHLIQEQMQAYYREYGYPQQQNEQQPNNHDRPYNNEQNDLDNNDDAENLSSQENQNESQPMLSKYSHPRRPRPMQYKRNEIDTAPPLEHKPTNFTPNNQETTEEPARKRVIRRRIVTKTED